MKSSLSLLEKVLSDVSHRFSNVGQIVLMVMVLLNMVDVVLRRLFNSPLSWTLEVSQVMLVLVVFFSVAYCGAKKSHVSIDALVSRFPPNTQAVINACTYFLSVLLFAFMTWATAVLATDDLHTHRVTGVVPIPIYPFAMVVSFGSLLLTLILLIQLLNVVVVMVRK